MTDTTPTDTSALGGDITSEHPVVVIGAGPAGLTAGYQLVKQGKPVIVLEATEFVGGIARTQVRDGYRFDLGGHRFFTKVKEVESTGTTSSSSIRCRAWTSSRNSARWS
jgi:protoporphyrinogen oxidase